MKREIRGLIIKFCNVGNFTRASRKTWLQINVLMEKSFHGTVTREIIAYVIVTCWVNPPVDDLSSYKRYCTEQRRLIDPQKYAAQVFATDKSQYLVIEQIWKRLLGTQPHNDALARLPRYHDLRPLLLHHDPLRKSPISSACIDKCRICAGVASTDAVDIASSRFFNSLEDGLHPT